MRRKSILFLTNTYPDFDSSSRGIFIKKMAELLQNGGYQISVVTPKIFKRSRYSEEQNGIKLYRFPFFARNRLLIEYKKIPYVRMILYYISGLAFTLYALLKNNCGLVHVHWAIPTGPIGVLAGILLKRPVVVTIHGSDFKMAMEGGSFLKKIFLRICQRASHINCVSEVMKKGIKSMGIQGEKISTFPMGVEESFLEARRNREKRSNGRPYTILSNRNLHPNYNVSLLLRAIPKVLRMEPEARFLVAGDGPERENLEKEAMNLSLDGSIQFLGRIPHEKMPDLLAKTDVYVSTSLSDGTSVSLLEAMAAGAFPIVTGITSNLEWIMDGKNGFWVSTEDEGFLARRIVDAIRNEALLEKSCLENLFIIKEKALWPVTIEKIKGIYMGLLRS